MKAKIVQVVTSVALVASLVPVAPRVTAAEEQSTTQPPIEELLSAGAYAPGEAIALVREGGGASSQGEELAEVDADAVNLAVADVDATETALDDEAQLRVQSQGADGYTVRHVVDPSRSTEQILRDLYADPSVIAAEPNYVDDATAAFGEPEQPAPAEAEQQPAPAEAEQQPAGEQQPAVEQPATLAEDLAPVPLVSQADPALNSRDLSEQQWYLSASTDEYTTPRSPEATYNINVPGWREGRSDADAPKNASGTVCIMDTGLDVTHPDLKDVIYTFSAEQQAKYGCGPHGMNASGSGEAGDIYDYGEHGTHVGGIVAAQWNGAGTSGIANGVKLFSVRTFDERNSVSQAGTVRGFKFLVDAAQDINLKAVNCSWGNIRPQFILTAMVNELGKKGVNTVFASGNRFLDLDENIDSGGQINSPYAIVVDAAQMDGAMTDFSCWGQASTDVFAPGAQILSSVPTEMKLDGSYTNHTRFWPEATAASNLAYGIDRFDSDDSGVRFFSKNPAIASDAQEIGSRVSNTGFDDKSSMSFNVRSLQASDSYLSGYIKPTNGSVFMAIPVDSLDNAKWLAFRYADSDANKFAGGVTSITCAKSDDGSPVQVDNYCVSILKKGIDAAPGGSVYWSQWMPKSLDVDGYVSASNEAHAKYLANPASLDFASQDVTLHYKDPGEVSGLYGWNDGGKTYVIAEIGLGNPEVNTVSDATTLYVDNVAVGNSGCYTGAYDIMAGTSMATPCVTACLTVIGANEPESSTLAADKLELETRERAAKLLASVDYDESLSKLCRTGGRVNLRDQASFDRKAPLITRSVCYGGVLEISGYFFGTSGTLLVDGNEVEPLSWEDGTIMAYVEGLDNGTHVVTVTNEDDAVMRDLFAYSDDAASGKPLYERDLSLPLTVPEYVQRETDRFVPPMVACEGKLFVIGASSERELFQGIWAYDIAQDTWTAVPNPEGFLTRQEVRPGCMAVVGGNVFLLGAIEDTGAEGLGRGVWRLDPATFTWTALAPRGVQGADSLAAISNELFVIGMPAFANALSTQTDGTSDLTAQDQGSQERSFFRRMDVNTGTLSAVKGDIPALREDENGEPLYSMIQSRSVSSNDKMYVYVGGTYLRSPGTLVRATYDAQARAMSIEDLTPAFKASVGDNLTKYVNMQTAERFDDHFDLAGLSDGIAIVGSDQAGNDTHIIKDVSTTAEDYGRTSCYHHPTNPVAAGYDGYLYAAANNATEPDVMYFRATDYNHGQNGSSTSQDGTAADGTAADGSSDAATLPKTDDPLIAASRAVALLAVFGIALLALARVTRRDLQHTKE